MGGRSAGFRRALCVRVDLSCTCTFLHFSGSSCLPSHVCIAIARYVLCFQQSVSLCCTGMLDGRSIETLVYGFAEPARLAQL